jgi:diketogulonate reductase-like aldo/keto reductase
MATPSSALQDDALLHCPTLPLRNGMKHPAIGFGTYKVGFMPASASAAVATSASTGAALAPDPTKHERTARECVLDALRTGYRFLECAEFYGNEAAVGQAIVDSQIPREELFLCSKVWTTTIEKGPGSIRAQLDQTLQDLQTDHLDLYLVHWPVPGHHVTAYKTLLELRNAGKIRGVGVSNYAWEDYLELKNDKDIAAEDLPLVNQIEINPFLYRKNTISKFQEEGVVLQSYRSLRDGKAMDHPTLTELAQKYNKTPAQILGRWCLQHGYVYTPKSVQLHRMRENAAVLDFALDNDDLHRLDQLTTTDALETFQNLYRKCVNRDTSRDGTLDGVKMNITID